MWQLHSTGFSDLWVSKAVFGETTPALLLKYTKTKMENARLVS